MCLLLNYVEDGMPDKRDNLHPELRQYHQYRKDLTTYDGVLLYKDRIIVPPLLRDRVLSSLHAAHQGVTQMTSRADTSVFWPGITTDINILRNNCNSCKQKCPFTAKCTTYPTYYASISIPVHRVRFFSIWRSQLPCSSGQI